MSKNVVLNRVVCAIVLLALLAATVAGAFLGIKTTAIIRKPSIARWPSFPTPSMKTGAKPSCPPLRWAAVIAIPLLPSRAI